MQLVLKEGGRDNRIRGATKAADSGRQRRVVEKLEGMPLWEKSAAASCKPSRNWTARDWLLNYVQQTPVLNIRILYVIM
jgi:hypothetical protein